MAEKMTLMYFDLFTHREILNTMKKKKTSKLKCPCKVTIVFTVSQLKISCNRK